MPTVYLPWKKWEQREQAVMLMHAGSHCSMAWDVARGHSPTWEFGNTPRFPYTVRAFCLKGKKHLIESRKHLGRKSEDKQNEVCECKHFPALPAAFQQPWRGHREQCTLYLISKSFTWNNDSVSLSSLHSEENVRADQKGGTASTWGANR